MNVGFQSVFLSVIGIVIVFNDGFSFTGICTDVKNMFVYEAAPAPAKPAAAKAESSSSEDSSDSEDETNAKTPAKVGM